MSVTEEIFKSIKIAVDEATKGLYDMDVAGIISEPADEQNTYWVTIDKIDYKVPNDSGMTFKRGDLVWVHSPNADFNKKFIIASRSGSAKSYTNDSSASSGGGGAGSITSKDIITDEEIDEMFL